MGREVMRVPLDFDHPRNKVWTGYLGRKRKDPPKGEGWQMWETTSEGSPMSPVFSTPEELAHWLAGTGASSFGSSTATYEQWLGMIRAGWAPTAAMVNGRMQSGVEYVATRDETSVIPSEPKT